MTWQRVPMRSPMCPRFGTLKLAPAPVRAAHCANQRTMTDELFTGLPQPCITVRTLAAADLGALLDLYVQLHPLDIPCARDAAERVWCTILANPWLIYIGAFADGVLVSTCHAAVVPNLTRAARPYGVIENVVTDTRWRRRGFGAIAMRALLDRCWAAGCHKVMLSSGAQRAEVHAFYEELGFDPRAKQAFVVSRPDPTLTP